MSALVLALLLGTPSGLASIESLGGLAAPPGEAGLRLRVGRDPAASSCARGRVFALSVGRVRCLGPARLVLEGPSGATTVRAGHRLYARGRGPDGEPTVWIGPARSVRGVLSDRPPGASVAVRAPHRLRFDGESVSVVGIGGLELDRFRLGAPVPAPLLPPTLAQVIAAVVLLSGLGLGLRRLLR